jgi:hypothetical protein
MSTQLLVGLHIKCSLLQSNFNLNGICQLSVKLPIKNLMKISAGVLKLLQADRCGRADECIYSSLNTVHYMVDSCKVKR